LTGGSCDANDEGEALSSFIAAVDKFLRTEERSDILLGMEGGPFPTMMGIVSINTRIHLPLFFSTTFQILALSDYISVLSLYINFLIIKYTFILIMSIIYYKINILIDKKNELLVCKTLSSFYL
jgi:hypothetical protein